MKRLLSILIAALMIFSVLPAQPIFAAEAPIIEEPAFAPAEEPASVPVIEQPAEQPVPVIEEPAEESVPVIEEPSEEPADAPVYKQGEPAEPVKASPFVDNDLNKLTQLNVTDCPNISNLY